MAVKVTLLCDEWLSLKGGVSTINRKLAISLSKFPDLSIRLFMLKCSKKQKRMAEKHKIDVFEAQCGSDYEKWWKYPPPNLESTDFIIGHGVVLGKGAPDLRERFKCKWVQILHTDPEELGNFKQYERASAKGEDKREEELKLCRMADLVVGIGPKLTESYSAPLHSKKVFCFTPGIFTEFAKISQETVSERETFTVLVFGRGDPEDVQIKGFDIAVDAILELDDESCTLMVVGPSDETRDEFRKQLVTRGISENHLIVRRFKRCRKDLADTFLEVDLVIMPSRSEAFGLTGLEGLSAGLPILTSRNSGLAKALQELPNGASSVVGHGANVTDAEIVHQWACEIKKVKKKRRDLRLKEARCLRDDYESQYSWSKQCQGLVKEMLAILPSNYDAVYPAQGSNEDREVRAGTDDEISDDDDDDDDDDELPPEAAGHSEVAQPPSQFKEGFPSERLLRDLAGKVPRKWQELGLCLGINQDKLDEIDRFESDKVYRTLLHWNQSFDGNSPFQVLYNALCDPLVARHDLARQFCLKE